MKNVIPVILVMLLNTAAISQPDSPECVNKGYTFFTKLEGYHIASCEESEFGQFGFWIKSGSEEVVKQGRFLRIWFDKDANSTRKISGLQILTNHANAIRKIGGQVLEGANNVFKASYHGNEIWFQLSPSGTSPDEGSWSITSIEVGSMKQEVLAKDIGAALMSEGKIALYGILFDFGKASLTPESSKSIEEIANFLKGNSGISIFIIGHTDNVGDYQANLVLSKSRAESVKNQLVSKYGIQATRLMAEGVGQFCPVGTNETEEGRQLNRRVEIVKK